eukprot:Nk52_evm38s217 gene=Nk52_evmTU38s217
MSRVNRHITLYTDAVPSGWAVAIALEELGLRYDVHYMQTKDGENKEEWFLKISPGGKLPAIVDHECHNYSVFETNAILMYVSDKANLGKLFPKKPFPRSETIQWTSFITGELAPRSRQAMELFESSIQCPGEMKQGYLEQVQKCVEVIEKRLGSKDECLRSDSIGHRDWIAADSYTIADIAGFCWIIWLERIGIHYDSYPHIQDWVHRMLLRHSVCKGLDIPTTNPIKTNLIVSNQMPKEHLVHFDGDDSASEAGN